MKSSRRQSILRSLENGRRRKSFLKGTKRRLFAEQLESREMLAGEVFHNPDDPFDTDNDGVFAPVDILHVINQLNTPASAASGEGPGTSGQKLYFNDVNNDGYVSPVDALQAINRYNARAAEGENGFLVTVTVQAIALDNDPTSGLPVVLTTIPKGTDYYLRVLVKDGRPDAAFPTAGQPNGVYAAYLDILYQRALTNVEIEELQQITFGNNPEGGTFRLTFDPDGTGPLAPQQTANITYTLGGANPDLTIASNIQSALDATFGTNNFLISPVSSGDTTRFSVRFMGKFGDQDVAMLTGDASGLTSSTAPPVPTMTFSEILPGTYSADSFSEAFRYSPQYDQPAGRPLDGQFNQFGSPTDTVPYPNDPNRIDGAGNFAVGTATLGASRRELFRVRMNSNDGGTVTFDGNLSQMVRPNQDTLLFGGGTNPDGSPTRDVVQPSEINVVDASTFTITEPFSAIADTFTFAEVAGPAAQALTVKNNDTPQPLTGISITKINGGTTPVVLSNGTVTLTAGAISFTPLANVNGSATFTYTLANAAGITDTATVTINVTAVNNAPVNTVPVGAQTVSEDTTKFFNSANGNLISIADIDANETVGATLDVNLSVTNGTIALGSIPGSLTFPSGGNNTSAMTIRGSLADLNTALDGLAYTPVQDYFGSDSLVIKTDDRGNTGTPGPRTDTDTISINVSPVNDAPTVAVPGNGTVLAGDPLTITGTSTGDVDVGAANLKVTISATTSAPADTHITIPSGALTGLTFTSGKENGKATIEFSGTLAAVNNALSSYTYTPAIDDGGVTETITVTVNDGGATGAGPVGGLTTIGTFTVEVIPLTFPFARRDPTLTSPASVAAFTVAEGSSNTDLPVLDNDLVDDPAGAPVTDKLLLSVTDPPHGTATVVGDFVRYTPDADFWGTDTFTYVMNQDVDGNATPDGTDSTGTVTVTITNINDAPVAVNSATSTNEDTFKDIVLSVSDVDDNNNAGPGGAPVLTTLTPTVRINPLHGTATVNANGTIKYTPAQDYNGPDSFAYTVSDGTLTSGTATVTITVDPVNDAPVAANGALTALEDITTAGTLAATDVDSATLTYSLVSTANAHGTVVITNVNTGAYTYTTDLNYNGPASFTFKANDGFLDSNTATVTITVTPQNDAPVANADSYLVEEDTLLNANSTTTGDPRATVRVNDSDVDNALTSLTVSLVSGPTHASAAFGGTFTLNADGSFNYRAELDYQGPDSFVYRLTDAGGLSTTATVSITVTEKNDPPVAVGDSYAAVEDVQLDVTTANGVRDGLGLDDDPDGNNPNSTLKVVLVSGPTHASVFSLNGNDADTTDDGAFSYKAAANYNGTDSFTYKLVDPFGVSSNTVTVTITIAEQNDNPTAVDDPVSGRLTLIKNTATNPFVNQEIDVLNNDSAFPDYQVPPPSASFNNINETLTITAIGTGVNGPQNGTATTDGLKVFYTPTLNYEGTDQFTYTISDGRGGFATATVFIDVVNFIPTDITGTVYVDNNNNGVQDGAEKPLAGVKITLHGHDDIFNIDFGEDTDNNPNNDVAALVVYTDINGNYRFDAPNSLRPGMRPGTYTIFEDQPTFMRDGKDRAGNNATLVFDEDARRGDAIRMTLPLLGVAGGINGNNFGEKGLDPNVISINEILASSTGDGLILAINGSSSLWSTRLTGWTNLKSCSVILSGDTSTATFTFTDMQNNVHFRTVPQIGDPSFRIMGRASDGSELIRLDATAADFGLNLLAAGDSNQQPEGEADDAGYARSVDELMTAVGNA
ncbi:MAG: Ig-like domain-containing protein [Pirellulaceae bacterium]